jgi:hypothetical protein
MTTTPTAATTDIGRPLSEAVVNMIHAQHTPEVPRNLRHPEVGYSPSPQFFQTVRLYRPSDGSLAGSTMTAEAREHQWRLVALSNDRYWSIEELKGIRVLDDGTVVYP